MKRTITTILAAVLMTISLSSFANNSKNPLRNMEVESIVNTYIEYSVLGKIELNNFLYADDFIYENTANELKTNKKEYLNFLKKNKGLSYNCTVSYEILDSNPNMTFAKTVYKFENFTRVDHITLLKSKDCWKINKITTSYL